MEARADPPAPSHAQLGRLASAFTSPETRKFKRAQRSALANLLMQTSTARTPLDARFAASTNCLLPIMPDVQNVSQLALTASTARVLPEHPDVEQQPARRRPSLNHARYDTGWDIGGTLRGRKKEQLEKQQRDKTWCFPMAALLSPPPNCRGLLSHQDL